MRDVPSSLSDPEFDLLKDRDTELSSTLGVVDGVDVETRTVLVESLPALVQLVGYLKYKYSVGQVLLRGQSTIYPTLSPSLFRPTKAARVANRGARAAAVGRMVAQSAKWECSHLHHETPHCPERVRRLPKRDVQLLTPGTPRYAVEPLLQHYGVQTRWLDVVDNLWVALWFACHRFVAVDGTFQHVVRRVPEAEEDADRFAYILTVMLMEASPELHPGLFRAPSSGTVVDLRRAVPSVYLRPHAQHGLLVHPANDDASNLTVVPIKVGLRQALEWLGSSLLLSDHGLFPPATVDTGYRLLLERQAQFDIPKFLGQIVSIGPGY